MNSLRVSIEINEEEVKKSEVALIDTKLAHIIWGHLIGDEEGDQILERRKIDILRFPIRFPIRLIYNSMAS